MKLRKGHREKLPRVTIDCSKCNNKPCCNKVVVKLDKKAYRMAKKEGGYDYLIKHGLEVFITKKNNILLGIPVTCQGLDPDTKKCNIWKDRPGVCRRNFLEFNEAGDLLCPKEAVTETEGS